MRIAIIGAGLAGVTLGKTLSSKADITLFEKSRGIGGRMSTRYAQPYQFDHGAQYFTAKTKEFQDFLLPYKKDNIVVSWPNAVATLKKEHPPIIKNSEHARYIAAPRMNILCKEIAKDLTVKLTTRVSRIEKHKDKWVLLDDNEMSHGPFDWVVSALPHAQAHDLMSAHLKVDRESAKMFGCFCVMLGLEQNPDVPWSAARPEDSAIGWIAINSNKPMRDAACSIVIQSTNEWAEKHINEDKTKVMEILIDEFHSLTNLKIQSYPHKAIHRWLYASTSKPLGQPFLMNTENKLALCGDWCLGAKVEAAFLSAYKLSLAMRNEIGGR